MPIKVQLKCSRCHVELPGGSATYPDGTANPASTVSGIYCKDCGERLSKALFPKK